MNTKDDNNDAPRPQKLGLSRSVDASKAGGGFGFQKNKTVTVEVRKTRSFTKPDANAAAQSATTDAAKPDPTKGLLNLRNIGQDSAPPRQTTSSNKAGSLTDSEKNNRMRALKAAELDRGKSSTDLPPPPMQVRKEVPPVFEAPPLVQKDSRKPATVPSSGMGADKLQLKKDGDLAEKDVKIDPNKDAPARKKGEPQRRSGKLTVMQALEQDERVRSMASIRRAREKAKRAIGPVVNNEKVVREVIVPEVIEVSELANRMATRTVDVIKALMRLGVMATASQKIDADTAELIVTEFGHTLKRVTDSDVENVLRQEDDAAENLLPRPPVVTIMGHVDHGKTSLLDAIRQTDVVKGEAGGITQHIGAYQITSPLGDKITFLDTPGHEAFTAIRARGAKVTDIVVLVVAADDGIMPQTIEAINHARSAEVPIIVAINKIDKPEANSMRVKQDLLQQDLVPEDLGGDVMVVEVSAKQKLNLDKLLEAIMLQAEVLELKANPNRQAVGTVVEAKVSPGRGAVATVIVQKGTLKTGDILVAGSASGRVRSLANDKGEAIDEALPSQPVEIFGLVEVPNAGDDFVVVENERTAREIGEFRQKRQRDLRTATASKGGVSVEQMFLNANKKGVKELSVIIKGDVHGSVEAIIGSLGKLANEEVAVKVSHSGVGGITESDVNLALTTKSLIIAFNVRANPQAKELAAKEGVDIRYYSIIYNVVDDAKVLLSGMMAPILREEYLGSAEIRQIFVMSKYGKVAGSFVKDGIVMKNAGVRLIRDSIVVYEGKLKTLKRFKDDVKEVKEGFECGIALENFEDMKEGDMIEAFRVIEERRSL